MPLNRAKAGFFANPSRVPRRRSVVRDKTRLICQFKTFGISRLIAPSGVVTSFGRNRLQLCMILGATLPRARLHYSESHYR